ncbi:hypothetical protein BC833DRAFT_530248 [Globomyces pollinis-pini]|nr:hypothetical protein BC833DRAFT_530248 [Globomyces pollinis-pini]
MQSPVYRFHRYVGGLTTLLLFIYFFRPFQLFTTRSSASQFYTEKNPKYDNLAIAVKTGIDIAQDRTPLQLLTFLAPVKNVILIGEAPGVSVGDVPMVDVYTNLYNDSLHHVSRRPINPKFTKRSEMDTPDDQQLFKRTVDAVIPDEKSFGWKADAHKNLPGFKVLYETFPDAEWYLMIDDDTYLFLDNLKCFLGYFNGFKKQYYFGAANVFVGCDGIKEFGKGPFFAHGGSGIILSRLALQTMLGVLDTCIEKYRHCWAGDIRIGLCLRDVDIFIGDPGGQYRDPPNDKFNFNNTCLRPFTFHHLLPHQMQKLYQIEKEVKKDINRFVIMPDVFKSFLSETPKENSNRYGYDYFNKTLDSVESCRLECQNDLKCVSYVYQYGICFLKDAAPPVVYEYGATTGIIKDHFVCDK